MTNFFFFLLLCTHFYIFGLTNGCKKKWEHYFAFSVADILENIFP